MSGIWNVTIPIRRNTFMKLFNDALEDVEHKHILRVYEGYEEGRVRVYHVYAGNTLWYGLKEVISKFEEEYYLSL